jgi:predicted secreted protein
LDKLSHTPSDVDFSQFQEIIKNMIENIILKNKKQFANKLETAKSYKLLEIKLNTINDSYNKKITGADNWLLAKKPLNSYQCASCESLIRGDLDPKSEYIP